MNQKAKKKKKTKKKKTNTAKRKTTTKTTRTPAKKKKTTNKAKPILKEETSKKTVEKPVKKIVSTKKVEGTNVTTPEKNILGKQKAFFEQLMEFFKKEKDLLEKKLNKKKKTKKKKKKKTKKKKKNSSWKEKFALFHLKSTTKRKCLFMAIFFLILALLLSLPYKLSRYNSPASNVSLAVPRFSKLKEECCNYNATFVTPRNSFTIQKELEKMVQKYKTIDCDGKMYYYNEEDNYTIAEYGVKRGWFLNEFYILYGPGNSCAIDTKFKKLELLPENFSLEDAKKDGNYVIEQDKVYNQEAYTTFIEQVNRKIPSSLRIVTTNKEGDVLITDLEYLSDGKYKVSYDGTRDRMVKNNHSIIAYKFEHLTVSNHKLYAYNGEELKIKKAKKYETYYLLDVEE